MTDQNVKFFILTIFNLYIVILIFDLCIFHSHQNIMSTHEKESIKKQVENKLKLVLDPELGISIVDLGLIYEIIVGKEGVCTITMTLTTIGCPLFAQIQKEIEDRVMEIKEINEVKINLTFDPPWTPDMMSAESKIQLGLD